ncbi:hypothetical protein D3C86_1907050 [compost metagenome]
MVNGDGGDFALIRKSDTVISPGNTETLIVAICELSDFGIYGGIIIRANFHNIAWLKGGSSNLHAAAVDKCFIV